jgi:2-oxoisovalerate dehydrogenase E1 component alpha subunit
MSRDAVITPSTERSPEDLLQILAPDGSVDEALDPRIAPETLLKIYRTMHLTRALDERGMNLQRQGRIHFYLASTGQEASSVVSAAALADEDWICPSYREPGAALYRGVTVKSVVHQLLGNAWDLSKGRQMPVHYAFKAQRFVSVSSPIGTQIVQAAGVAMAMKIRHDRLCALTYMGDGGTSSNDFHTGLNFAGVYKAPVIFFCENNGWAISLPVSKQTASKTIAIKAEAYGMPGVRIDGNDTLAVWKATHEARERALRGEGPTLIEAVTYRLAGHSSSDDPRRYRPESECEAWTKHDPVARLAKYLEGRGLWDDEKEQALKAKCKDEVNEAVKEAERVPRPELETIWTDVYAEMPKHLRDEYEAEKTARGEGRFP